MGLKLSALCFAFPPPLPDRRAGGEHPEIVYSDIDLSSVLRVRSLMPVTSHEMVAAYQPDDEERAVSA